MLQSKDSNLFLSDPINKKPIPSDFTNLCVRTNLKRNENILCDRTNLKVELLN